MIGPLAVSHTSPLARVGATPSSAKWARSSLKHRAWSMARSTCWPCPVSRLISNAASSPTSPCSDARTSAVEMIWSTGGVPSNSTWRATSPALGVDDRRVRRPGRLRPVLAEPGDRQHDEAGVAGREVLPVEVEPGQHPRAEVLDDDVGGGGEIGDERRAAGRAEVDRHVPLPGVLLGVVAGQAVDDLAPQPRDVALGRLDLDDVGTEVGQHPTGQRTRQHPGQVQHADAVQRVHGRHTVTDGGLVGAANVGVTYGVMSMSSSSISPASTPCFHSWWAPSLLVELRHHLGGEQLEAVHDVGVRRHAGLVQQDDLVDVRLLPLAQAPAQRFRATR